MRIRNRTSLVQAQLNAFILCALGKVAFGSSLAPSLRPSLRPCGVPIGQGGKGQQEEGRGNKLKERVVTKGHNSLKVTKENL